MKSLNYIIGLLAGMVAMVSFSACNQIKEDERTLDYEGSVSSDRYVLLEDFSGAKCVNCPRAVGQAHNLTEFYGDNVIVVAYYPQLGNITEPYPNSPDLRTEVAQTYATYYAVPQLPNGLVNRTGGLKDYKAWASAVTGFILDSTNYARLSGKAWRGEGEVNVEIEGGFVESYNRAGEIGILAMVIEDSIVAEQLTPTGRNAGYVHNHVFRMLFSDVWGDKVLNEKPEKGTEFAQTYRATVSEAWRSEKLSVVAALVNMRSREVIQAA
ncbi:MAG: Omp28 family outer membrane lipoprotein, partial [Bacteroidales bacterium]|nr:Omp28 family outer membrane lipoprotein [Bacteroidales bacterium]